MKDSKLNKKVQGAVRTGGRKVVSGTRNAFRKMRPWQVIGLALCLVSWIASAVIGAVCGRITGKMVEQNCVERWGSDRESAQISAFFSNSAGMSDEKVQSLKSNLANNLQMNAIALSDVQIENGASLFDIAYCGIGNAELTRDGESVTATMIGVGEDFFNFHPLEFMDGTYFSGDELMQDRILLDEETAWRLFGSPNVIGMSVMIGGTPHYIAGVFRRPEGRFYKYAGMGSFLVFCSYDSLCRYTEAGIPSENDSGEDDSMMDDSLMEDAAVPRPASSAAFASAESPLDAIEEIISYLRSTPRISPRAAALVGALYGGAPDRTLALEDEDSEEETEDSGSDMEDSKEEAGDDSAEEGAADADDPDAADETDETLDSPAADSPGDGRGQPGDDFESDPIQKEEVNRERISCLEVILPNPVSQYAAGLMSGGLNTVGIASDQYTMVENSSRFDTFRLALLVAEPGVRSMQTAAIRYPYWENVALAWEDVLIPFALLQLFLRYAPILFLLFLLMWYATHKSWTVGGLIASAQDKIYERQAERIYGKPAEQRIEAADAQPHALPENGTEEETASSPGLSGGFPLPDGIGNESDESGAPELPSGPEDGEAL